MFRFHKTPPILPWLFPKVWWRKNGTEQTIYLTFDDGPIPEVTPFVLEQLAIYNANATFFCVGENIERYPNLAQDVKAAGHRLANHTYQHVKAWNTSPEEYLWQVEKCQSALDAVVRRVENKKLFRPPHGQLTRGHLRILSAEYQTVMWSSLTYDFDQALSPENCLKKAIASTSKGSIVVLHDSLKAEKNLRFMLPKLLQHFFSLGYSFKTL